MSERHPTLIVKAEIRLKQPGKTAPQTSKP